MPSKNVMKKFRAGKLHSGSKRGPVVTNPDQAIAVMYSERREEDAGGGHEKRERPKRSKR